MKRIIVLLSFFTNMLSLTFGQPPNNNIFYGSAGDGFTLNSNSVLSNNFFLGGNGDGSSAASNNMASNNIFFGGSGDGFNFSLNLATSNSIFTGGAGDGFTNAVNVAPPNNIYLGGEGDGWSLETNSVIANSIFLGGEGDGWATVVRPLGPLPVLYNYFLVSKIENKAALLKWATIQEFNAASFDVERSEDGLNFYKLATVIAAGNSSQLIAYNFIDYHPKTGNNFYRLKQIDINNNFTYTEQRLLQFTVANNGKINYYPNPTKGKLKIDFPAETEKEFKLISVFTAGGSLLKQIGKPANSNNTIEIDFSNFSKGVYIIQVKTSLSESTQQIILE